ncbi:MAG: class I SAM-dependent methyltransferase [Coriobacteriia bacterium]|nr:class I SAM-dependent methyltransferase [Coriobacteriia bacterium]
MERRVSDILNQATCAFYAGQAESFSQTRRSAWPGWLCCLGYLDGLGARVRLLDLACGNLRFESFLERERPAVEWSIEALDSCADLFSSAQDLASPVRFRELDLVSALLDGDGRFGLDCSLFVDACVSFGFFHHVPGFETRVHALSCLLGQLRPGGIAMVSLWQFAKSPELLARAQAATQRGASALDLCPGDLEPGDYLMGWRDEGDVFRYCHSFAPEEIDELLAAVSDSAELVERFEADGRTGDLNTYLVLRRR